MKFEQHCLIAVSREELWNFLLDIPQAAGCVPGAEDVIATGGNDYRGRLRVRLGPIRLKLEGVMVIQQCDREQWRVSARSEANDRRIGGGAKVTGEMRLLEHGQSDTELVLSGEVRFMGKLGEFGEPLIRKRAEIVVADFARNVAARFSAAPSTLAADSSAEAVLKRISKTQD
jgi:uncharacterized protein